MSTIAGECEWEPELDQGMGPVVFGKQSDWDLRIDPCQSRILLWVSGMLATSRRYPTHFLV